MRENIGGSSNLAVNWVEKNSNGKEWNWEEKIKLIGTGEISHKKWGRPKNDYDS